MDQCLVFLHFQIAVTQWKQFFDVTCWCAINLSRFACGDVNTANENFLKAVGIAAQITLELHSKTLKYYLNLQKFGQKTYGSTNGPNTMPICGWSLSVRGCSQLSRSITLRIIRSSKIVKKLIQQVPSSRRTLIWASCFSLDFPLVREICSSWKWFWKSIRSCIRIFSRISCFLALPNTIYKDCHRIL